MAEPALILVFFTVGVVSASDNPYLMNHAIAHSPFALVLPTHLLGLVAFFMIVLVENGRIPIENPGVSTEISMIEEGRELEEAFPAVIDLHERVRDPVGPGHLHGPAQRTAGHRDPAGEAGAVRDGHRPDRHLVRQAALLPDRRVPRRVVPAGPGRRRHLLRDRGVRPWRNSPPPAPPGC